MTEVMQNSWKGEETSVSYAGKKRLDTDAGKGPKSRRSLEGLKMSRAKAQEKMKENANECPVSCARVPCPGIYLLDI